MTDQTAEYIAKVTAAFPDAKPWILGDDGRTPVQTDMAGYVAWTQKVGGLSVKVAYDDLGDTEVSTIFLDQFALFGDPKRQPFLFETLVRSNDGETIVDRYRSWDEAEEAHARIVASHAATTGVAPTPKM